MIANKQMIMAVMSLAIVALLPGCWPFGGTTQTKASQDLYVINVLDKGSFDDCRIAGSTNVPFEEVETFAKDLDRKAEVVVYCANYMCSASGQAAKKLKDMGFENVWAYEGGSAEWYQMGLKNEGKFPIEGTCKASYLAAANEKPAEPTASAVPVIGTEELYQKMTAHGLISVAQAPAETQEAPQ
jgi:rhodanese-related sulfurtransferase